MGKTHLLLAFSGCCTAMLMAQTAPRVVSVTPPHLSASVDAKTSKELIVVFDQAMSQTGWSLCGGGPQFPKIAGKPAWRDERTLVVTVELEPDHDYSLGLNCPAAKNFRSAAGVPLVPVPWSFTTLPLELPDQKAQKARNQAATKRLWQELAEHYSHRDLRVRDWAKLEKAATPVLLASKTDQAWAAAAATALQPTEDLHLSLKIGERTWGTGSRAIDPLFSAQRLADYVKASKVAEQVLAGRTDDDIGYLLIASWRSDLDLPAIEQALTGMLDCKAMVIDVRPNAGGDEGMAQKVAAWFVEGTKVYARNRYRERAGKNGFGKVFDRTVTGNDENRRFGGPIAVLTSRYVMSSNESFVMMLEQARDCTSVGQPTFGSSGNPRPAELGNGVTIFIPRWQDLRLDGTCFEGQGLAPDVPVEVKDGDFERGDPILAKALEVLRGKIRG
ncbi:MAG: hypothetical protein IPK26_09710 [Planctomycetes bacterium]|nr:hypothetical protein [Planctomycetota bacterium]